MDALGIMGISLGLAMDAFAVAIASSVAMGKVTWRQYFRLSFHFGLFQFAMPVIGWLAGTTLAGWLGAFDHWVALALLAFVGGKMIKESLWPPAGEGKRDCAADPTRGSSLVVLSIATSIDALAVGISFAMLRTSIWLPCVVIGIVAAALTALGLRIGSRLGNRFGRRMEAAGGIVLVGIGVKIVVEHLLP